MKQTILRWFHYHQRCFRPGQPQTVHNGANIAAVAGLIKYQPDVRLTVKNITTSVGILSRPAHEILTQQLKLR